jgi:hypothetical protein
MRATAASAPTCSFRPRRSSAATVQVGEVAKEEHEPLPLGQARDRLTDRVAEPEVAVVHGHVGLERLGRVPSSQAAPAPGGVDDPAPDPSFERPLASIPIAPSHRADEAVVHGVRGQIDVADDPNGDAQEGRVAAPVDRLELREPVRAPPHAPSDPGARHFL